MYIFVKDSARERVINELKKVDSLLDISNDNFITTSKNVKAFISTMFNFEKLKDEWFIFVYQAHDTNVKTQIALNDVRTVYDL